MKILYIYIQIKSIIYFSRLNWSLAGSVLLCLLFQASIYNVSRKLYILKG